MIEVTTDVWRIDAPLLKMPAGVRMPLAATILRLPDRSLVIYGPIKFDDAQLAAIEALGEVAHLVAPNLYHHLFLPRAMARWPRATVHAPAGLEAKRAELTAGSYRPVVEGALAPTLDVLPITGAPKLAETVLFHRPSGTLVCADLVFNVTHPANLRTRMALSMMGTGGQRLA
ncbi:MAG: hypothetical protein NT062_28470, partial [Proteobacteria bacterium]|nr:hypothetical protein [Pseudomonadota bacterium]